MLPVILMAIDIITGTTNAWIKNELDSSILRKGLGKKLGEITAILIGEIFVVGFGLTTLVADGISLYIIIMELISICENLEQLGVPIPKFIKNAFRNAKEKLENDDNPLNDISGKEDATDESDDGGNAGG
jgi:toxin secretion/phage lysis holin